MESDSPGAVQAGGLFSAAAGTFVTHQLKAPEPSRGDQLKWGKGAFDSTEPEETMAFHPRLGGRTCAPTKRHPRDSRSLIRRHLREEGKTVEQHLSKWWNMTPHSAHRRMYDMGRVLSPVHIAAVVEGLKLDAFDAQELYRVAAIEAGFKIGKLPV